MPLQEGIRTGVVGVGLALLTFPAMARKSFALPIGAAEYQNLDPKNWLRGSAKDVRLVQTYLTAASPVPFEHSSVIVLADGVEGAQTPTLAAIRAPVADLTARVQPRDFVFICISRGMARNHPL